MNTASNPRMTPSASAARCSSAVGRLLPLILVFATALPPTRAALPDPVGGLANNALYKKGYLDVNLYQTANGTPDDQVVTVGDITDSIAITATTAGINRALQDAYANNVALYFPTGTYVVNDTLKAHTATGGTGGATFATPRRHLAVIGSTTSTRPLIKLAANSPGFGPGDPRKPILEFKNFAITNATLEAAGSGYFQMLRGVDIDCGGNRSAIGLYFNQAQNSSVENVRIDATGALTGILGLPARGWGAVNIEIEGGDFGIDTRGLAQTGAGTVIAGAVFRNQAISAVRQSDFVPMVIVGFEIQTPAGSPQSALRIEPSGSANAASLALIDGRITLGAEPAVAAIDNNAAGQSIHVRNLYVTGSDKLVKSLGEATVGNATGPWKRIDEYTFCDQSAIDGTGKITQVLVEGVVSRTPPAATLTGNAGNPPADLITRHRWISLPSADDPDAVDVTAPPSPLAAIVPAVDDADPAVVDSAALQAIIDTHRKVFLPKGVYRLTAPGITLGPDTILFGAARSLTRITVAPDWNPTEETSIIQTDVDAATTYLGDLTIGVKVRPSTTFAQMADFTHDFFTALDWQAGRDSMVHIGQPYRIPDISNPTDTQDHSLLKIHGNGGGRWYFAGSVKTGTSQNAGFRLLEVTGTSEPLWFYGLNPEHALGTDTYCEFTDASNIRIYAGKSEFSGTSALRGNSVLIRFSNVSNVAKFGHGAFRNAVLNHGCIEFLNSTNVLAALINPQNDVDHVGLGPNHHTLRQTDGANTVGIQYPNCVALYKKGTLDEAAMTHHAPSYGPEYVFYSTGSEDGWVREFNETSNVGSSILSNGNGPQALSMGDNAARQQYKGILSFNTAALPPAGGAVIHAATLELVRGYALGDLNSLGSLRADIKTGSFISSPLSKGDFQAAATATDVIPVFPIPAADGEETIGMLNATGQNAINANGLTQFRVYFSSDDNNDNATDQLGCYSGENPTGANRPILRVQYRQP